MSSEYAATLAICYLRKMRQWNEGKIDLAVPGEDPPYRMDQREIDEAMQQMIALRDAP
jgi:hypothetical protein